MWECHALAHLCLLPGLFKPEVPGTGFVHSLAHIINTLVSESLNKYLINISCELSALMRTRWEGQSNILPPWGPHVQCDGGVCEYFQLNVEIASKGGSAHIRREG